MGCDIHSFVEKRNTKTGSWEQITGFKNDYYDSSHEYFSKEEYKNGDCVLSARNYDEFAILADVRNGYGFAGCDTGDAIKPIAMPKGLPEDVSSKIKKENPNMRIYTQIEWIETVKECAEWLFGDALKQLLERSDSNGEDIRIVFWFDN